MKTLSAEQIDWSKGGGLVPAIVQDADTQQVLMLGYMNAEALAVTQSSGRVSFFSRSRNRLWTKGEASGNVLHFVDAVADCDNDAILVRARPTGPACHRNTTSCFGDGGATGAGFLARLDQVVASRLANPDSKSYTSRLAAEGVKRATQKVGEEAVETAIAGASGSDGELAGEAADLIYHLIVLLRVRSLGLADAIAVLEKRHHG